MKPRPPTSTPGRTLFPSTTRFRSCSGGGIYLANATAELTNVTVSGNSHAAGWDSNGGGIYAVNSGTLTVTNSAIYGNVASSTNGSFARGGGIHTNNVTTTLTNATVTGNTAISASSPSSTTGGGIYSTGKPLNLYNTIVYENRTSGGNDAEVYFNAALENNFDHTLLGADPGFVNGPLWVDGALSNLSELDLRLKSSSIAIDRGSNEFAASEVDLAGLSRSVASRSSNSKVDIGAYEYQETAAALETYSGVVTTSSDVVDATDGVVSLREALEYSSDGGTVTFSETLDGARITLSGVPYLIFNKSVTVDASSLSANSLVMDADGKSSVANIYAGSL